MPIKKQFVKTKPVYKGTFSVEAKQAASVVGKKPAIKQIFLCF